MMNVLRIRALRVPLSARPFSTSTPTLKKAKKDKDHGKKGKEEPETTVEEDPSSVLTPLEAACKEAIELFKKKTAETKQGNANPTIFDQLKVEIHKENQPFTSIAQTSLKGRNLLITVFDPNNVKHIVSSVLASGMNMNPQAVPNFPQQLKVSLPPPTAETRKEIAAALKKDFDHFKHGTTKHSLSAARGHALKQLKEFQKNDQVKKLAQDVEKVHKKWVDELTKQYKQAEKSVL